MKRMRISGEKYGSLAKSPERDRCEEGTCTRPRAGVALRWWVAVSETWVSCHSKAIVGLLRLLKKRDAST